MRVVVTGAAGYMGKHVVKELLKHNHEVFAVDLHFKEVDERATLLDVDIFAEEDVFEKLKKPDLCIHLAWRDGFIHNSPLHMQYLSKHFGFIKNMIDGGCKNIAVMGTMHEIGYWEGEINENTPCNPLTLYGIAKNALRQSLMQMVNEKGVNLYWLRAYYILGDDMRNCSIFTKLLMAVEDGKKEFPFTSGKNKYDFIDVKELSKQIVLASTQETYTGIINVCTGKPVSLADKVEEFIKDRNLDIKLLYGAFPDRNYDSPIIYGNADKINEIIFNSKC